MKFEATIVAAAVEGTATEEASRSASQRSGAREVALTLRTRIKIAALLTPDREREVMATRFTSNPEISAGESPFRSVRRNPAPAGAKLRQQMRQLVAESAINLGFTVSAEPAIEKDSRDSEFRASSGCAEPVRPLDAHFRGERGCTMFAQ